MSEQYPGAEPLVDDRHELFCHEYLIDLSIKNAAARAGFSERSARQHGWVVFNRPEVKERIAFLREERNRELGLDSYYVLKNLKSIAERCMQAEEVMIDGEPSGEFKFEHSGANKALELIGKHIGMFVEQKKISVEVDLMSEQGRTYWQEWRANPDSQYNYYFG